MLSITIGKNVKKYRLLKHITQEGLAYAASICVKSISKVESGKSNVTIDLLESIAKSLDVNPVQLISEE